MSSSHDSTLPGLHLANTGSYPRIGDGPELQILRRATTSLDRGDRNTADLLDAENDMIRRAIADQLKAGLEVITDGQIRWYDPISHLVYVTRGDDVQTTIVNGKVLMRNRKLLTLDTAAVLNDANAWSRKVRAAVGSRQ